MINFLKKIFGSIKMTWFRLIAFSTVISVITILILICPIFKENAIQEIGIRFEWWLIFALFIISNCNSPLEAGSKTFVFFLISQALVFLIQQAFESIDLFSTYYFRWFICMLLTFPGGIIAYYVKKDKFYSPFILALVGVDIGITGCYHLMNHLFSNNLSYILYGLFFILFAYVVGLIFLNKKSNQFIYHCLTLVAIATVGICIFFYINNSGIKTYDIGNRGSWKIQEYSLDNVSISMKDSNTLLFDFKSNCHGEVYLVNENEEQILVKINVKCGEVSLIEKYLS